MNRAEKWLAFLAVLMIVIALVNAIFIASGFGRMGWIVVVLAEISSLIQIRVIVLWRTAAQQRGA